MIETVIDYINADIQGMGIFQSSIKGLCEMIKEPFEDSEGTVVEYEYPAFYIGKDSLRYITHLDYKAGVLCHVMNGEVSENELDPIQVRHKRVERTYPLKCIALVRRDIYNTDTAYSPLELLSNLQNKISKKAIPVLKDQLGVEKIVVNVTNGSTDKPAIIEETFINVPFPTTHNLMAIKIEYNIVITGNEDCFNNYGCQ